MISINNKNICISFTSRNNRNNNNYNIYERYKVNIKDEDYIPIERTESPWFVEGWYNEKTKLPSEKLQSKSTLREREWYNEAIDVKPAYISPQYDIDDIPLSENIMQKIKGISLLNPSGINTDIPEQEIKFNQAVHSPWINPVEQEDMKNFLNKKEQIILNLTDNNYKIVNEIFNTSKLLTGGKNQVSKPLCNLAVELLENSGEWGDTEKEIINNIKIPIYKKVYGNYSKSKYRTILSTIDLGKTNEEILEHISK